jgi:hypothetical protein
VDSFVLGALNVLAMSIAFSGRLRQAAWVYIALQVPWSVWDVASRNYGFLLIGAGSLAVSIITLVRRRQSQPETCKTISEGKEPESV